MNRQIVNRRYRVERRIGEGGTAEVYLGFDIVLNRRVAIKTLRPQFAANRAFRLRFEREAQQAARFSHPNIISIFDVGEDGGLPFIIMEFIDGQTLKEIIDTEGPFHPDDVAILIEQVAAGLDYAHQHGLVHRDVKPQNILVDRHGLAKVVDFGIAKGLTDKSLTETGSSLGTVHYISPEQASGLMATPESDIYSLGVIAYEMLTGQLPFESDSSVGVAMRHLNDQPVDPAEINPNVPPEAADVVLQALSKNPTRRYPTAGAFARALSDWRLYQPKPRLAAKLPSATTTATRSPGVADTVPSIRSLNTTEISTPAKSSARVPVEDLTYDDERGGKSWIAGVVALAAIAIIAWFGLGLSDRFNGESNADPTSTAVALAPTVPIEPTVTTAPVAPTATSAPQLVAAPNVVGLSQQDAEAVITGAGLNPVIGQPVESAAIPTGAVVQQSPAANASIRSGTNVVLQLSSGPPAIDLASLQPEGRPSTEVINELKSLGLNVAVTNEGSATIAADDIIRLEPADKAKPGDTVTAVVSMGNKVQIPVDIQGAPLATARTTLVGLGLTVSSEIGVDAATITAAGLDMQAAGIEDGDIVGIQDNGANFGQWIDAGVSVTLVYYDASLDTPTAAASN